MNASLAIITSCTNTNMSSQLSYDPSDGLLSLILPDESITMHKSIRSQSCNSTDWNKDIILDTRFMLSHIVYHCANTGLYLLMRRSGAGFLQISEEIISNIDSKDRKSGALK